MHKFFFNLLQKKIMKDIKKTFYMFSEIVINLPCLPTDREKIESEAIVRCDGDACKEVV